MSHMSVEFWPKHIDFGLRVLKACRVGTVVGMAVMATSDGLRLLHLHCICYL